MRYLRKWGVVSASGNDRAGVVAEVLAFFRVGDVEALTPSWAASSVAYRKATASLPHHEDLMTWLTMAERDIDPRTLLAYDENGLRALLPELRTLTRGNPETYVEEAIALLRHVGVGLVVVPEVPKLGIYGATRWLQGHPVIQLSLRGKTDDQLWFTLFHEIGHVLLHSASGLYIAGADTHAENEADTFASDTLIPPADAARMPVGRNIGAVEDFAAEIGIAAGIVLGRIHRETGDYRWGHRLKQHFVLVETVAAGDENGAG
jgi:HTH-type transcriptional regulator/antitoxin HigA